MVSSIPAIVFSIPDLDGIATMTLISKGSGDHLACLKSVVDNGKSTSIAAAKYATAGVAAAALVLSSFSALGASSGTSTSAAGASPNFGDVMFWFQSIAMDGMLSVSYPSVYRSFTDNFQWSTGLLTWEGMQSSIDSFRSSTGGNTTEMSIYYLMNNVTLVYDSSLSESAAANTSVVRRGLDYGFGTIFPRDNEDDDSSNNKVLTYVNGVKAKVETLKIPSANTFMTVLLIFCIVLASVAVSILLFKVILEIWALFGSFPKSLTGFRKRYWMFLLTTIVRIVSLSVFSVAMAGADWDRF